MKRIITGLTAALALALVGTARADDTETTKAKSTTTKKSTDTTKSEKKSTTDSSGMGSDPSTYSKDVDKSATGLKETDTSGKPLKQEKPETK